MRGSNDTRDDGAMVDIDIDIDIDIGASPQRRGRCILHIRISSEHLATGSPRACKRAEAAEGSNVQVQERSIGR
jgi:hypothetical protein